MTQPRPSFSVEQLEGRRMLALAAGDGVLSSAPDDTPVLEMSVTPAAARAVVKFDSVTPYGEAGVISGRIIGANPRDRLAVFTRVNGGWWTKPRWDHPATYVHDGEWQVNINTGGDDAYATDIAAFVIPRKYGIPLAYGSADLPARLSRYARFNYHIQSDLVDGAGTPKLARLDVPALNSYDDLLGTVLHVRPSNYAVAAYIKVGSTWWTKPYWSYPTVAIGADGKFTVDVTTGGIDETASKIALFVVPVKYNPPSMPGNGWDLPSELYKNSVAHKIISR